MTDLTNSTTVYPLSAVRALALHAQGLGIRSDPKSLSTLDEVYSIIEQIGCLQIDTLQMVRRSQNIALWSRLGSYDPADLDRLLSDGKAGRADRAAVRDRELSRAKPADDQFGALVVIPDIGAGGHGEGGADPVYGHRAVGLAPLPMIIEAPVKPCESTSKSAPAVISSRLCADVLSGTPAT